MPAAPDVRRAGDRVARLDGALDRLGSIARGARVAVRLDPAAALAREPLRLARVPPAPVGSRRGGRGAPGLGRLERGDPAHGGRPQHGGPATPPQSGAPRTPAAAVRHPIQPRTYGPRGRPPLGELRYGLPAATLPAKAGSATKRNLCLTVREPRATGRPGDPK